MPRLVREWAIGLRGDRSGGGMDVTQARRHAMPPIELRDMVRRPDRWSRLLVGATVAGLIFGVFGPYSSFTANPVTRLCYWTMLFWAGAVLLWPSVALGISAGARRGVPPAFAAAVAALGASIPLAVVAAAGCYLFWPVHASGIRPAEWYVRTAVIALPAIALAVWLEMGRDLTRPASLGDDRAPSPGPPAATRAPALPSHLIDAALCLQMEDHHIRVHTVGRSQLHLAPLRQIAEQLGPARGLQVHRSWWVARSAVRDWQVEGRAVVLILTNGLRVPVARNRVARLRAAGWLPGKDE
jgi:hypothetical protein